VPLTVLIVGETHAENSEVFLPLESLAVAVKGFPATSAGTVTVKLTSPLLSVAAVVTEPR
jgi:hypothetical protein